MSALPSIRCQAFQPQLWRKNVCKECFQKEEQHVQMEESVDIMEDALQLLSEDSQSNLYISPMECAVEQPLSEEGTPVDIRALIGKFSSASSTQESHSMPFSMKMEIEAQAQPTLKRSTEELRVEVSLK